VFMAGGSEGFPAQVSHLHAHIRWDAAFVGVITVETSSFPSTVSGMGTGAADVTDWDVAGKGNWLKENPSDAYVTVISSDGTTGGATVSAGNHHRRRRNSWRRRLSTWRAREPSLPHQGGRDHGRRGSLRIQREAVIGLRHSRIGHRDGVRVGSFGGAVANPMAGVAQDATSSKYVPATAAQSDHDDVGGGNRDR